MTSHRKTNYKSLRAEWYAKLKKEGFEDIEQNTSDENPFLKNWDSSYFYRKEHKMGAARMEAVKDYYLLAVQFLSVHNFKSKLEKEIWRLHSEGHGVRVISKELNTKSTRLSKYDAHKIVKVLTLLMKEQFLAGDKQDTLKQLNEITPRRRVR